MPQEISDGVAEMDGEGCHFSFGSCSKINISELGRKMQIKITINQEEKATRRSNKSFRRAQRTGVYWRRRRR